MQRNTFEVLESYIKGKDQDEYLILEEIYADDAVVEFEISSDSISFPEIINGNKEIARVLSKDFNKNYNHVKTYYLSKPPSGKVNIYLQNWLVVMRDVLTEKTRVGTGHYDWEFTTKNGELKIQRHKIYIHEMVYVEDVQMIELTRIQGKLFYPWVERQEICAAFKNNVNLEQIIQYLK